MALRTNQTKPMPKTIPFCPQTLVIKRFTVRAGNVSAFHSRFIALFIRQHDFRDALSQNQFAEYCAWKQYPDPDKRVTERPYFESVFVVLHRVHL